MKDRDINIKIQDTLLNIRAVAIIVHDNKILFQKRKNDEFLALPGGKVRVGEKSIDTINRELREELEIHNFEIKNCNSISEYFFTFKNTSTHQYIFSYIVEVDDKEWIIEEKGIFNGKELDKDLIFNWFSIDSLDCVSIKPDFLKKQIENIKNGELIFTSYSEE